MGGRAGGGRALVFGGGGGRAGWTREETEAATAAAARVMQQQDSGGLSPSKEGCAPLSTGKIHHGKYVYIRDFLVFLQKHPCMHSCIFLSLLLVLSSAPLAPRVSSTTIT